MVNYLCTKKTIYYALPLFHSAQSTAAVPAHRPMNPKYVALFTPRNTRTTPKAHSKSPSGGITLPSSSQCAKDFSCSARPADFLWDMRFACHPRLEPALWLWPWCSVGLAVSPVHSQDMEMEHRRNLPHFHPDSAFVQQISQVLHLRLGACSRAQLLRWSSANTGNCSLQIQ